MIQIEYISNMNFDKTKWKKYLKKSWLYYKLFIKNILFLIKAIKIYLKIFF